MARPRHTYRNDVQKFVDHVAVEEDYSERTLRFYKEEGNCIFKLLDQHIRPGIRAADVTKEEAHAVINYMRENDYKVQTMKGYVTALKAVAEFHGNDIPRKMKIRWPHDTRPNVDWLTPEQAFQLVDYSKTPTQEIIIHLELGLGFRRVEVARLKTKDINRNRKCISVVGKAGKLRLVPFHPDTEAVLEKFDAYRNALHYVALSKDPRVVMPPYYVIWGRGKKLSGYSQKKLSGLDEHTKSLSKEIGFHFSNHTLRRTFGRMMWKSGVDIVTIAMLFGHKNIGETIKYIGIDLDEMETAMQRYVLKTSDVEEEVNKVYAIKQTGGIKI